LEDNILVAKFKGGRTKNLRAAITGFFESLILCESTIDQFEIVEDSKDAGTLTSSDDP